MNRFNKYYKTLLEENDDIDLLSMFPPASKKEIEDRMTILKAVNGNMSIDIIKKMIDRGDDVNERDEYNSTPLHYACYNNNYDVAKILIDNGADVNAKDRYFLTSLLKACFNTDVNIELVKLLIDNGADVNIISNLNTTPLYYARKYNNKKLIDLLIKHGAKE